MRLPPNFPSDPSPFQSRRQQHPNYISYLGDNRRHSLLLCSRLRKRSFGRGILVAKKTLRNIGRMHRVICDWCGLKMACSCSFDELRRLAEVQSGKRLARRNARLRLNGFVSDPRVLDHSSSNCGPDPTRMSASSPKSLTACASPRVLYSTQRHSRSPSTCSRPCGDG